MALEINAQFNKFLEFAQSQAIAASSKARTWPRTSRNAPMKRDRERVRSSRNNFKPSNQSVKNGIMHPQS